MTCNVFIAQSLDGCIADKDHGIAWLDSIPNPDNDDCGYFAFMENIDALVMGRNTFEIVAAMDIDWPYTKPVFVLSTTLKTLPEKFDVLQGQPNQVELVQGEPHELAEQLGKRGYNNLYIDGGKTIQSFLQADLIEEMTITTLPILLGGGPKLFDVLSAPLHFELVGSTTYLGAMVQNHYRRKRSGR